VDVVLCLSLLFSILLFLHLPVVFCFIAAWILALNGTHTIHTRFRFHQLFSFLHTFESAALLDNKIQKDNSSHEWLKCGD